MRFTKAAASVLLLACAASSHAVKYKAYYEGIPDYENSVVFHAEPLAIHEQLRTVLRKASKSERLCVRGKVKTTFSPHELKTNICDSASFKAIKSLLAKLAPSLDQSRLAFRKLDLDRDGEPELLVEFVDVVGDENVKDPYLSLWLLRFNGQRYKATHIGPFLVGEILTELPFGQRSDHSMLLVRHLSCTECRPWVYLSVLDFLRKPNGDVFQFTYDEDHKSFGHTVEYSLPGMGHSVDAEVETRAMPPSKGGPHLLQRFALDSGKTEWWIFTCNDLKCDFEMTLDRLPRQHEQSWKKGRKL